MTHPLRKALAAEAAKHGFTLDYSDLRSGLFFIKRGTEVRRGWIWRTIKADKLARVVHSTTIYGTDMRDVEGSRYYVAPLRAQLCTPMTVGQASIAATTVI